MAGFDPSRVAPSDAAVTMASLPRRFGSLFATPMAGPDLDDEPDPDDLAHRIGPDGRSAADHLALVVRTLGLLERALGDVVVRDRPVLHPAVLDEAARTWEAGDQPVGDLLHELDGAAEDMAARIRRTPAGDWDRSATIAGGGAVAALDLAREAVRTAVDHLAAADQVLAAVRGR